MFPKALEAVGEKVDIVKSRGRIYVRREWVFRVPEAYQLSSTSHINAR